MPFRNAFPILMRNAGSFLVSERTPWIHDHYQAGDVIEPLRPLPSDLSEISVARPPLPPPLASGDRGGSFEEQTVAVREGTFAYDQTSELGPLRFAIGEELAYTAINLTNEHESRIKPVHPKEDPREQLALSDRIAGLVPWLALAVFAALLVGLEWLTYHFRWTE